MGTITDIAWTDHTFNPWMGCTHVHAGCTHCYAESFAKRYGKAEWGPNGTRVLTSAANWRKPLKWNREAEAAGVRAKVFCASLADVFEDWKGEMTGDARCVETMDEAREHLFQLIDQTPYLDWQLLTKRPENIRKMWCSHVNTDGKPPSMLRRENVWLGTSISEPKNLPKIEDLIACRDLSPVLFASCEPLLSPVSLAVPWEGERTLPTIQLDWVIVGGESGGKRRDCGVDAIVSVVRQCQRAGVPCFVKQDCAMRAGQQGRIPDDIWAVKEFPKVPVSL